METPEVKSMSQDSKNMPEKVAEQMRAAEAQAKRGLDDLLYENPSETVRDLKKELLAENLEAAVQLFVNAEGRPAVIEAMFLTLEEKAQRTTGGEGKMALTTLFALSVSAELPPKIKNEAGRLHELYKKAQ